jgi:hypothetical protein
MEKESLSFSIGMEKEMWYGSDMIRIKRCGSPKSMYCSGNCRYNPFEGRKLSADVVGVRRFVSLITVIHF